MSFKALFDKAKAEVNKVGHPLEIEFRKMMGRYSSSDEEEENEEENVASEHLAVQQEPEIPVIESNYLEKSETKPETEFSILEDPRNYVMNDDDLKAFEIDEFDDNENNGDVRIENSQSKYPVSVYTLENPDAEVHPELTIYSSNYQEEILDALETPLIEKNVEQLEQDNSKEENKETKKQEILYQESLEQKSEPKFAPIPNSSPSIVNNYFTDNQKIFHLKKAKNLLIPNDNSTVNVNGDFVMNSTSTDETIEAETEARKDEIEEGLEKEVEEKETEIPSTVLDETPLTTTTIDQTILNEIYTIQNIEEIYAQNDETTAKIVVLDEEANKNYYHLTQNQTLTLVGAVSLFAIVCFVRYKV